MKTHAPSTAAFEGGQETFAGRVLKGKWADYVIVVFTYVQGGLLRRRRPSGYLVQFFRPSDLRTPEIESWGQADYAVESLEELEDALRESSVEWIPWDEVDDFLHKQVPGLFGP